MSAFTWAGSLASHASSGVNHLRLPLLTDSSTILSVNEMRSDPGGAIEPVQSPVSNYTTTKPPSSDNRRNRGTNVSNTSIELVANTLLDPPNMMQFGMLLEHKHDGKNKIAGYWTVAAKMADYMNKRQDTFPTSTKGFQFGKYNIDAHIERIKEIALVEVPKKEAQVQECGRGSYEPQTHESACCELMRAYEQSAPALSKRKPQSSKAYEHPADITLVTDDRAQLPTTPVGHGHREQAIRSVGDNKKRVRKQLIDSGVDEGSASKISSQQTTRPGMREEDPGTSELVGILKGLAESTAKRAQHETVRILMEEMERCRSMYENAMDEEEKEFFLSRRKSLREKLQSMSVELKSQSLRTLYNVVLLIACCRVKA